MHVFGEEMCVVYPIMYQKSMNIPYRLNARTVLFVVLQTKRAVLN